VENGVWLSHQVNPNLPNEKGDRSTEFEVGVTLHVYGSFDARPALRSGPGHVEPGEEMVMAESLGDECCKAARTAKGHRRASLAGWR
jgi:hypothetical protein